MHFFVTKNDSKENYNTLVLKLVISSKMMMQICATKKMILPCRSLSQSKKLDNGNYFLEISRCPSLIVLKEETERYKKRIAIFIKLKKERW
jgi:hypothetical protein